MKMVSFEVLKPPKLFYVTFILIFTQLWVNVLCGEKLDEKRFYTNRIVDGASKHRSRDSYHPLEVHSSALKEQNYSQGYQEICLVSVFQLLKGERGLGRHKAKQLSLEGVEQHLIQADKQTKVFLNLGRGRKYFVRKIESLSDSTLKKRTFKELNWGRFNIYSRVCGPENSIT
uniref:Uncharacterized protein n=1 Tax=Glossina austeni TaxID=7395 RepID=A0A1A9VES4_GLOAU